MEKDPTLSNIAPENSSHQPSDPGCTGSSSTNINTEGGAAIGRDLTVKEGGVFVGRDQHIIQQEIRYDVTGLPNPYLGLVAFTYEDRAAFGGREQLVRETVERITAPGAQQNMLFITGASGSGKSSFAQAGLLPALEAHYRSRNKQVTRAVFRPSTNPIAMLADAIDQLGLPQLSLDKLGQYTAEQFSSYLSGNTPAARVNLVVIDQFEEFFRQSDADQRDRIFSILTGLPSFEKCSTHFLVTLRSDFLKELFEFQPLWDIFDSQRVELRAMSQAEVKEAIKQPMIASCQKGGTEGERYCQKQFEPALLDRLSQDASKDAAYLPLLQVTLQELWNNGSLKLSQYTNLTDAIRRRAEAVYGYEDYETSRPEKERPAEDQQGILDILVDLVDVSLDDDSRRDVRCRRKMQDLIGDSFQRQRLVDTLISARLLSVDREKEAGTDTETVDIIHESLINNWERLKVAISEKRQMLQRRSRYEQQFKEWQGNECSSDFLLTGIRLAEASELERQNDVALRDTAAKSFLRLSLNQAEAVQRRRIRNVIFVAIGLSIALLIAIAQTWQARTQAEISLARQLATQSQEILLTQPTQNRLVALLSIESLLRFPERNANQTITNALIQLPNHIGSIAHEDTVSAVAFSPDGKWVVSGSDDNTARVWEAASGNEVAHMTHEGGVSSVAFSPDGKWVISGSYDNTARVWEAASGKEVSRMMHEVSLYAVAFSQNGEWVVSGGCDIYINNDCIEGTARVWEAATGKEVARMRHEGGVHAVAFSPDGKWLVSGSHDSTARVWEAASGNEVARMTHKFGVDAVAFSPDGKWVVSGSQDNTAHVWVAASGKEVARVTYEGGVSSVAFSPDGKWVVSGSRDGEARVWEAASGNEVARVTHEGGVSSVALSPDGKWLVSGSGDGTARLWETASGNEVAHMSHEGGVSSVAFSPDGKWVVSGSGDGTARLWETASGNEVAQITLEGSVQKVAFSPDGKFVLSSSDYDGTAQVWEAASGREVTRMSHDGWASTVAFSPDGKWVVSDGGEGTVRVWEAASGREVTRKTIELVASAVAFSPDGKWVVSGSGDGTVRVWEAASGNEVTRMTLADAVQDVAFSPDGKWVVSGSRDGKVRVWEAASGNEVTRITLADVVQHVAFSPDGKWVISVGGDGTVRVWEAVSGNEVAHMTHEIWVYTVAFSPDGNRVVSGGFDGIARVWETTSGREVARMNHINNVSAVAFSPDGKWVVSGSGDGTARVWEAANGREVARMILQDGISAVEFSPNGKWVISSSINGTAQIWLWRPDDLIELACSRLDRNLTKAEWQQYMGNRPYRQTCPNLPPGE